MNLNFATQIFEVGSETEKRHCHSFQTFIFALPDMVLPMCSFLSMTLTLGTWQITFFGSSTLPGFMRSFSLNPFLINSYCQWYVIIESTSPAPQFPFPPQTLCVFALPIVGLHPTYSLGERGSARSMYEVNRHRIKLPVSYSTLNTDFMWPFKEHDWNFRYTFSRVFRPFWMVFSLPRSLGCFRYHAWKQTHLGPVCIAFIRIFP